jgi:hypothetical protein
MTPFDLSSLGRFQQMVARGEALSEAQQREFDALRRELAMAPEVADDPKTLFTDESRRPQLDGTDYLDEQKKRDCDDFARKAAEFMEKHGAEALDFAIKLGMTLFAAQTKR